MQVFRDHIVPHSSEYKIFVAVLCSHLWCTLYVCLSILLMFSNVMMSIFIEHRKINNATTALIWWYCFKPTTLASSSGNVIEWAPDAMMYAAHCL